MTEIYERKVKFDERKQIIELETILKRNLYYEYSNGNVISVSDEDNFIGDYEYHDSGNIKSYRDTDGVEISYGYIHGRLGLMLINSRKNNNVINVNDSTQFNIVTQIERDSSFTVRIFDTSGILIDYAVLNSQKEYDNFRKGVYQRGVEYVINKIDTNLMEIVF